MLVTRSSIACSYFEPLRNLDVEEFWALALDSRKRAIARARLFRGTADGCLVHPRDVFRFACLHNASGLIVAHNHPNQDPSPSAEDQKITDQLVHAGAIMQIDLYDHLILTRTEYFSFADQRLLGGAR